MIRKGVNPMTYPVWIVGIVLSLVMVAQAQTGTIDPTKKWAWGTNIGWINFRPTHGGVTVYSDHLEGYAWGENIGWIRLGTHTGGSPHTYGNTSNTDYGVNNDGSGNLSGYAWGTNVSWISFNPTHGGVTIDPTTGDFDGYAWGENVGWIHFNHPGPPAYKVATLGDIVVPVELGGFAAHADEGFVTLSWFTGSETENLGYHLYRSLTQDGTYERITEVAIQGAGSSRTTHTYEFVDRDVQEGVTYFYKLEDVDFSGNIRMHGPVSVFVAKAKPTAFALWQNHPNPFNPTTAIAYDLAEASDVRLTLYTLTGQQIATLVSGYQDAGHYEVVWDGSGVANGLYLYRLEAGQFTETKRMLLLK